MKSLKYLVEKEFKQIFRNSMIPKMIVGYPIMVLLFFPWAINFEVKNVRVDVVDNCKSVYSKRLTDKIEASKYFILNDTPPDYNTAFRNMDAGESHMIVEIPASFDRDLVKEKTSKIAISANSVNGTQGLLGSNYVSRIVNDFSAEIRGELAPKFASSAGNRQMPRIEIVTQNKFNEKLDYKVFMLPGFMVIMITLICGILPALNIVSEKEVGTINQINVTPVSKLNFILAKLIPYWIIGVVIMTISIFVAYIIYGFWPSSNFFLVLFASVVFIFSISGMGIIISNYSNTMQQASFLVIFFILIIFLLSGMFTPVSSMPYWAQIIAYANPLTYFILILRMLYLNGSNFGDISYYLLYLVIFAVFLNGWAVISYRKRG